MNRRRNRNDDASAMEDAQTHEITVGFTRLTPNELREIKEALLNIVSAALIQQPRMSITDPTMQKITQLVKRVAFYDPEFVLKLALYVRLDLNIRSTANYLLALGCNIPECQPFFKKYFVATVRLPSDWLDVAATYMLLPDRQLANKSLPTCLRKAMTDKFPDFDAYQLGKYNKERTIKRKLKKMREEKAKNPHTKKFKGDQKPMITIKQMIRQLHIAEPTLNVMSLLGKKYPLSETQFRESRLSGNFEPDRAGQRMKLPVPETWETLLSEKGNKSSTWEELIEHKKLPFMAMLRNLRNMIMTGVHHRYHRWVQNKLSDARAVASSKQFPFQFFSAYEIIPRDMEHFKQLLSGEKDNKKGAEKAGDKAGDKKPQHKRKKTTVPTHMPTDKIFEDYRKAIDQAVKHATIHNVSPIRGTTIVFCNVSKETRESAPGAKGMGSGVRKIQEVGYLLGLMCKYVCEECDFRIYSSPSDQHPNTSHLSVELIEGTILENMKVVSAKAAELGDQSQFPFDYLKDLIRDKHKVDNFLVLSHSSINPGESNSELSNLLTKYRSEVNPDMLFVSVDLSGSGKSAISSDDKHPNDITITGFSDQILRFIAERGDQNQLQYVEHIDEAKEINKKDKKDLPPFDVSPWWRWLDSIGSEEQLAVHYPNIVTGAKWRSARVFISSTFLDMHGERDILTRIVFPEIKERAKQRKLEVFEVDLRWGVTEEESQKGKSIQICLDEVERCQPFFIGMLGDRYGWAPENWSDVPDHPRFDWVRNYPSGRSITELEMQLALKNSYGNSDGTFFYVRDSLFVKEVPEAHQKYFTGKSEEEIHKMAALKQRLRESGLPLYDSYPASYGGETDGKPSATGLNNFASRVFSDLWGALDRRFPQEAPSSDLLEVERSYHQSFVHATTANFTGRKEILDQMNRFTTSSRGNLLVITGKPGDGKSSILSVFAKQLAEKDQKTFVLPHFVGASPGSTDIRKSLHRLCSELKRVFDLKDVEIPDDYKELSNAFPIILEQAVFKGKLVIVIDAINQLDNRLHRAHSLDWLPAKLPCKFIVSTLSDDTCFTALTRKYRAEQLTELKVLPLTVPERTEIVRALLWQYHKKLDERPMNNQMRVLLKKVEAGSPLYLSVACEELRIFGVYEKVSDRIKTMGPNIAKLFDEVLVRLETDHGKVLVQDTCALLAISRNGLLEDELRMMVDCSDFVWQGFLRSLSAFLKPSGDRGELCFFHQQFGKAVEKKYLNNARLTLKYHAKLADHFYQRADPDQDGTWKRGNDAHAINELPHHLVKAERWASVVTVLGDLTFIELKITVGQAFDLISDYNEATAEASEGNPGVGAYEGKATLQEYKSFVKANAYALQRNPLLTFQQAANQPSGTAPAKQAAQRWNSHSHTHSWLRWVNKPRDVDHCKMTYSGYQESTTCAAFSEDGKIIAVASRDCLVRLYNAETGTELTVLSGHSNWIVDMKFSSQGGTLATASWDCTAKVWDTRSGSLITTLSDHERRVNSVSYSSDGQLLATASWDCTIKIWKTQDFGGQQQQRAYRTINAGSKPINSCSFCAEDKCVMAGGWDGKITQFLVETGAVAMAFAPEGGHIKSVQTLACSPNGKHAASGSLDQKLILWDAQAGKSITTLARHGKEVTSVAFTHDGTHLISSSADATTKVWNSNLGRERRSIKVENCYLNCCAFSPKTESRLAVGSSECNVVVYDLVEGKEVLVMSGHTRPVSAVEYSPSGAHIASCSEDGAVMVWNADTGALVHSLKGHNGPVNALAWSPIPEDNRLATGSDDFTIRIWDTVSGTEILTLAGHTSTVRAVAFDPKGKLLGSGSRDNTVRVWDSRNGNQLHLLTGHTDWLSCLDFAPDGSRVVSGSWDMTMRLWNLKKNEATAVMRGHGTAIASCKFSANSKTVVSSSFDGSLKVWDAQAGTEITTLAGHKSRLNGMTVSKDGKYVASVSDDQTIKVWDPLSASEIATLIGHAGPVRSSTFAPTSSKQIITASDDKTVKIWDVGIGEKESSSDYGSSFSSFSSFGSSSSAKEEEKVAEPLGNLQGHSGWITDVKISANGDTLISVSDDGSLGQWDLHTLERLRTVRRQGGADGAFKSCDIDPSGNLAITAADDGTVSLWDLRGRKKIRDVAKHVGPATSCAYSSDGNSVISAGWDKSLFVSDTRKDSKKVFNGNEDWVLSASMSGDRQNVVSGGWDKAITLFNANTTAVTTRLQGAHTHTITSTTFSPDSRYFASSSYDSTVKLWNTSGAKLERILVGHHGHVNAVTFTPKIDNALISVGSDHAVKMWDIASGDLKNEFVCQGPATAVHAIRAKDELLMAFGDSIGNLYFTKYQSK